MADVGKQAGAADPGDSRRQPALAFLVYASVARVLAGHRLLLLGAVAV